jgi:hemoglobin
MPAALYDWARGWPSTTRSPGARVVAHAPVPRWGWGEAPPFDDEGA